MKTFLTVSDEVTESMHSAIRLFEDCHRYVNKKKGSKFHAKMQHKYVVHLNIVNFGDFGKFADVALADIGAKKM